MRCQFCRKKIGWLRRLKDREFCSAGHRERTRMLQSARLVRDVVDLYGDEPWLGAPPRQKPSISPGSGLLLVALCVLLLMLLPGGTQQPRPPQGYLPPTGALGDRIMRALPGKPTLSMREDFRLGLRNWMSLDEVSRVVEGWSYGAGWMKPGNMRLWKPTLQLADYQFEFEGQIEKKAINWAFRATDQRNFYGTKLAVAPASHRAEITRTVRVNGQEFRRLRLPIPIEIREGVTYLVKVRVKGDRFHTIVNGQLVDSWTDRSLRAGGIGFYSDPGERAGLRWVSISDRESFLQRFLTLSFLVGPVDLLGPLPPLE